MKVLLLAEPPAGDKVSKELEALGVEVEYRRGLRRGAMAEVIRPGFDFVLAMNANGMGATLKAAARHHGARYVAIPPGWSQVERVLRENQFFADLEAEKPLTHKPLAAVAPPAFTRHQAEVIVGREPEKAEAAPAEPRDGLVSPSAHGGREADEPTMPARGGLNDQPVNEATVEQAKRILAKNPRIGSGFLCDLLRSSGHPVNRLTRTAVVAARHAAREAAGLRPDGFVRDGFTKGAPRAADILRPAAPAAAPPAIAPVPPPAPAPAAFEVPPPVRAAAQLLAEALRESSLVGEVTVTSSGAVAFDLEVRRSFQGRLTV